MVLNVEIQTRKKNVIVFFLLFFLGAVHLAGPIAKISKGLCKLSLSHCGLTAKGVNQMAHSLSLNQSISTSLTYLDLSGNNLRDDINVCNFVIIPPETCLVNHLPFFYHFISELIQFPCSTECIRIFRFIRN